MIRPSMRVTTHLRDPFSKNIRCFSSAILNKGVDQLDTKNSFILTSVNTRNLSSPARLPQTSEYEDVVKFLEIGGVVIDVREPKELINDGVIPNAVNIPLRQVKEAFQQNPDAFEKKYQVKMPAEEDPIIFSCLAGIRSAKAEVIVNSIGFTNTSNYQGGFADWATRNK